MTSLRSVLRNEKENVVDLVLYGRVRKSILSSTVCVCILFGRKAGRSTESDSVLHVLFSTFKSINPPPPTPP